MPSKNILKMMMQKQWLQTYHRSNAVKGKRPRRKFISRKTIFSPGKLMLFFFLLISSFLIFLSYYFERKYNNALSSFFNDHFLSLLLFQEYVERPRSIGAQVSLTILWLLALLFSGAVIGKISSFFVISSMGGEKLMCPKKNHYIICGHNWRTEGIIEQINAYQQGSKRKFPIVIANAEPDKGIEALVKKHENVYFQQLDPTHHDSLELIRACKARCIILLIDYNVIDSDAKNALIALAISKLEKEGRELHIVAEARHSDRIRHLKDAGVDEVISSIDLSVGLIAQAAIHSQSSEIYSRLLHFTEDTNDLYYVEKYSPNLWDKSFLDAAKEIAQKTRESDNPVILIGIKRNVGVEDELFINPRKQKKMGPLQRGDILIVLSYRKPENL